MGWHTLIVLILLIAMPVSTYGQYPPSSPLSRQVVIRQRAFLQKTMIDKGFEWGAHLFIRIFKAERRLEVWLKKDHNFEHFKSYPICTYGGKGLGPKTRQGDGRAPEGFYWVSPMQMNPYSRFYLAFNLGYPNAYDRHHGRTGSAIMVDDR